MGLTSSEQIKRRILESTVAQYAANGRIVEADASDIRQAAVDAFTRKLDAKIKNLQEGERLTVDFDIQIVGRDGKIRGGSGSERNMPEYIEWRSAVYARDNYKCRECGDSKSLNAHHVKQWAHYPELRFDVDNGLTLCAKCHAKKHPHIGLVNA